MYINKTQIAGVIGKDAESRQVGERWVVTFSVAVSRKVKEQEYTTWFDVECWMGSDKLTQYLTKGKLIFVEGEMKQDRYEDKEGNKRQSWRLLAHDVQFFPQPKQTGGKADANPLLKDSRVQELMGATGSVPF